MYIARMDTDEQRQKFWESCNRQIDGSPTPKWHAPVDVEAPTRWKLEWVRKYCAEGSRLRMMIEMLEDPESRLSSEQEAYINERMDSERRRMNQALRDIPVVERYNQQLISGLAADALKEMRGSARSTVGQAVAAEYARMPGWMVVVDYAIRGYTFGAIGYAFASGSAASWVGVALAMALWLAIGVIYLAFRRRN